MPLVSPVIVWTAVCHLQQICSSQWVVSGTSPRRWPLGMFALTSSSPPGSMCSRSTTPEVAPNVDALTISTNPETTEEALTAPCIDALSGTIVGVLTISTNLAVVERALSMSINPAVPSTGSTCKLALSRGKCLECGFGRFLEGCEAIALL